jgi:hypothetical protein
VSLSQRRAKISRHARHISYLPHPVLIGLRAASDGLMVHTIFKQAESVDYQRVTSTVIGYDPFADAEFWGWA